MIFQNTDRHTNESPLYHMGKKNYALSFLPFHSQSELALLVQDKCFLTLLANTKMLNSWKLSVGQVGFSKCYLTSVCHFSMSFIKCNLVTYHSSFRMDQNNFDRKFQTIRSTAGTAQTFSATR